MLWVDGGRIERCVGEGGLFRYVWWWCRSIKYTPTALTSCSCLYHHTRFVLLARVDFRGRISTSRSPGWLVRRRRLLIRRRTSCRIGTRQRTDGKNDQTGAIGHSVAVVACYDENGQTNAHKKLFYISDNNLASYPSWQNNAIFRAFPWLHGGLLSWCI